MAEAVIPVELSNPGQVLACLGFMEASEILLGEAEGGFDWSHDSDVRFILRARGLDNPVASVLEFLAEADPKRVCPAGYQDPPKKNGRKSSPEKSEDPTSTEEGEDDPEIPPEFDHTFPARTAEGMALPIRFGGGNRPVVQLDHWADGSGRGTFKLYAGNRSAAQIAQAMLMGVSTKPTAKQKGKGEPGRLKTKGIRQLWQEQKDDLIAAPFNVLTPMGGSFNFDPRGAWTAIDAGYSPNDHGHAVEASPVVEFLAAWGLQNARPVEVGRRLVRYAAWGAVLPLMLARAALAGSLPAFPVRRFRFDLDLAGKNKIVTFAEEESGT